MIKRIVPPMSNEIITLVKDTSPRADHRAAGDHMGRSVLPQGIPGNLGGDMAAVFYRCLLSDL